MDDSGARARWRRTVGSAGGAVVLAVVLAGCGAGVPDRAGGDTVVLHLATIDGEVNSNGQLTGPATFVKELGDVSGGRLRVEVADTYGDGEAGAESRLVKAIATGKLDGGWPATRAFAAAGISGLQAVEAPLTLTSSAAVDDFVTGPAGADALGVLAGSGVTGLALTAGTLRRPFASQAPLLGPEDWAGQPIRVFNSPVQSATVTALGGTPVNAGLDWVDELRAGHLRGAEFDVAQYAANDIGTEAGGATANVVLWPKVFVLAMSSKRFDALTPQQQRWVRRAAERARQASVDEAAPADTARAQELCDRGVRFVPASDAQLAALHAAVAPVIDRLAADPTTAPLLAQVQAVAQRHPDVETVEVPADCQSLDGPSVTAPAVPTETSALPDGVYRVALPAAEVAAAGVDNGPGWSGTWTLEIKDGTYAVTCRPIDAPGRDCGNSLEEGPLEAGEVRGTGSTATFVWDGDRMAALTGCHLPPSTIEDGACYPLEPYSVEWTLDGDQLAFSAAPGSGYPSLTIKPYRKIA